MRARVLGEMKRSERTEEEFPLASYFNNFHCHLPGGLYREFDEELRRMKGVVGPGASRRRRGMSVAEFHEDIDRTIAELGLDIGAFRQLRVQKWTLESRDRFERIFLPVYIRLREKGYKHYPDLTA